MIMVAVYTGNESGIHWKLNRNTHILNLFGKGPLPDFDPFSGQIPNWTILREQAKEVHIEEGVTRIGSYSFYPYDHGTYSDLRSSLRRIVFPSSLESIGSWAFRANTRLDFINLRGLSRLHTIEDYAFASCFKAKAVDLSGCIQLKRISSNAFWGCDDLSYIDLSGCTSLSDKELRSLRKATPEHIPIIMPTGEISFDEYSLNSCARQCQVFLGGTWSDGFSIPQKAVRLRPG